MLAKPTVAVLALVAACSSDGPTLPDRYRALEHPADAADAAFAIVDADFSNADVSQDGAVLNPCAFDSTVGTGIMSGTLAGASGAPALQPSATLDRFPDGVPVIFENLVLPVPEQLQLRRDGLIAVSSDGFFDVDRAGEARSHSVDTLSTVQVLSVELDGDGDEDAISLSLDLSEDANGAGELEMVVVSIASVWERKANGELEQRARIQTRTDLDALSATLADYDGDGDLDVITTDGEGGLHALRNDGSFELKQVVLTVIDLERMWTSQLGLFAEDRNRDGAVDLIALVQASQLLQAHVYLNDGTGAFASPVVSELRLPRFQQASFGDVTGDGLSDLVLRNESIAVARSRDAVHFDASTPLTRSAAQGLTLADVDADTVLDVAVLGPEGLRVFLARDELRSARVSFEVASDGLRAFAIESATDEPARLHALYHTYCGQPCDDSCRTSCIFEACIECVAHSDCGEDQRCVSGTCTTR